MRGEVVCFLKKITKVVSLFTLLSFVYNDADVRYYSVSGIDISSHTGKINFDKIKKKDVSFIYIKATEGASYVDPRFRYNYSKSVNKFPIGFYHFFKFNKSGEVQANNFLRNIKNKKYNLPLVVDVEDWGNGDHNKNRKEIRKQIKIFVNKVERKFGKKMMIYTNESGYRDYIAGNLDKNHLWICSFSKKPNVSKKWTLWQYSHKGRLKGAEGWIDLNVFNGNKKRWKRFLAQYR